MKLYLLIVCALPFIVTACSTAAPPKTQSNAANGSVSTTLENSAPPIARPKFNPAEAVKFSARNPSALRAGSSGEAEITLDIQNQYHVNSNPPSEKSFIPLEIIMENGDGITVGKPVYPKGELKKFAFSEEKPLSVYSGEIVVKLPLKAGKTISAGQHNLKGKLKFQPCDEEICYRPQTIDVMLPVTTN